MPDLIYKWPRFWYPRGTQPEIERGGYLVDPESWLGKQDNAHVVPFSTIRDKHCAILLGGPGVGKSTALREERAALDKIFQDGRVKVLPIDLRSIGSEQTLYRRFFENPLFIDWFDGDYPLYVLLDSLDEGLLHTHTLTDFLIDELKHKPYPVKRLFLRIACRTAVWRSSFEQGLKDIWCKGDEEAVGVFKLAPLRRKDVLEAATANGLEESFVAEIERVGVVPLAVKPITLKLLLKTYDKGFPKTQMELYEEGCRELCMEPGGTRLEKGFTGQLNTDECLSVASRIAAVTIFGRKATIYIKPSLIEKLGEDITIEMLSGVTETARDNEFKVTESAIAETLSKDLFEDRGQSRRGWGHQTIGEFLAARHLVGKEVELVQIMSLIKHPEDPDGKLVPQLYEVAAWLARLSPPIFREILRVEPEILLRSDVEIIDDKDKEDLTAAILRLFDEEQMFDRDYSLQERYNKLNHPNIAAQLRQYIADPGKSYLARDAAIDIARACEVNSLQNYLADIALDPDAALNLRINATSTLVHIGDEQTKRRLKPLASGQGGPDPREDLKGYALKALWPTDISASELFSILSPREREGHYGALESFIASDITPSLQSSDLADALGWVERQGPRRRMPLDFKKLMDSIMLSAWQLADQPEVIEPFAEACFSRLRHHEEVVDTRKSPFDNIFDTDAKPDFRELVNQDNEKRRAVLAQMVRLITSSMGLAETLKPYRNAFVIKRDFPWMVEQFEQAGSPIERNVWAYLIGKTLDNRDMDDVDLAVRASEVHPEIRKALAWFFKYVELDSQEASELRQEYLAEIEASEDPGISPLLYPPPSTHIIEYLDHFDLGNLDAWWRLLRFLPLEDYARTEADLTRSNIVEMPGWNSASDETRKRLIEAAKKYVVEFEVDKERSVEEYTYEDILAGYKALRLLLAEEHDWLESIKCGTWQKWLPVLLLSSPYTESEREANKGLVKIAYRQCPDVVLEIVLLILERGNWPLDRIEHCWDETIESALLAKLKDDTIPEQMFRYILQYLLINNSEEGRNIAESLVTGWQTSKDNMDKAVEAAILLALTTEDAAWLVIWPAIKQEEKFGRAVIGKIIDSERNDRTIGNKLSDTQLTDLSIWLARQFPHSPSDYRTGFMAGTFETPAWFRDRIFTQLVDRGTREACSGIERITKELPHLGWLKYHLLQARHLTRRKTWRPPAPEEILKVISNKKLRLVRSSDDLLLVIIESLGELQKKLHGETPAVYDLWLPLKWNYISRLAERVLQLMEKGDSTEEFAPDKIKTILGKTEYNRAILIPRDEAALSDYVSRHLRETLKERGIIVNREVEIRRGQETDIKVEVNMPSRQDLDSSHFTVIIEVKGSWNAELHHAMKSQLVDRYLRDFSSRHGLYLIGWFYCHAWDDSDIRKSKARKDIGRARKQYEQQARDLSQADLYVKAFILDASLETIHETFPGQHPI